MKDYDPVGHLSESDGTVDRSDDPQLVRVHIKASKSDPFRKGVFVYLGKTGVDLCPVAAVSVYLAVHGCQKGPLFCFVSGVPLSRDALIRHVRVTLRALGVDVSFYSGHSFRIGAATTAAAVGMEYSFIKTLGRWESSAYLRYVKVPHSSLVAVSQRMVKTGLCSSCTGGFDGPFLDFLYFEALPLISVQCNASYCMDFFHCECCFLSFLSCYWVHNLGTVSSASCTVTIF